MADAAAAALKALEIAPGVESKKPYYEKRVRLFEEYKARALAEIEKARVASILIRTTSASSALQVSRSTLSKG